MADGVVGISRGTARKPVEHVCENQFHSNGIIDHVVRAAFYCACVGVSGICNRGKQKDKYWGGSIEWLTLVFVNLGVHLFRNLNINNLPNAYY